MNRVGRLITAAAVLGAGLALRAAVEPVAVDVKETTAWTGERIRMQVEIRAQGSFGGATSFMIPEVPGTFIMQMGHPIVASRTIEGESWFIQIHEFSIFSQVTGDLRIPAFAVQYGARNGFTGPVEDREGTVPEIHLTIKRPPGSEDLGFLVSASEISISESWDPEPASVAVGDVFKRTITQSVDNLSGMALQPYPLPEIPGLRIYPGQPQVEDMTERGAFAGKRVDSITYLVQEPGLITIPSVTYNWWDPAKEVLNAKVLPEVSFSVPAPPARPDGTDPGQGILMACLVALAGVCLSLVILRQPISSWIKHLAKIANPPHAKARRQLLRACRKNDPHAAEAALYLWDIHFGTDQRQPDPALQAARTDLHRFLYRDKNASVWNGQKLSRAVKRIKSLNPRQAPRTGKLPLLNP